MYRFVLLLIIYPVRCFSSNGSAGEALIYKGFSAEIHQFPHAVFLSFETTRPSSCGGSLIMVQAVLTAAHCVDELRYNRGKMHAYFGAEVPNNAKIVRRVIDYRINPKYNENKGTNNLAVAFLQSRVPLQHLIKKIPLSIRDPELDELAYSVGWGRQTVGITKLPNFSKARSLKGTQQEIMRREDCSKYTGYRESPTLFCSRPLRGHFYRDDVGDGLVVRHPTNMLAGVLSFVASEKSMYTSVYFHSKWIIISCRELYEQNCVKK